MKEFAWSYGIAIGMGSLFVALGLFNAIAGNDDKTQLTGLAGLLAGVAYVGFGLGLKNSGRSKNALIMVIFLFLLTMIYILTPLIIERQLSINFLAILYLFVLSKDLQALRNYLRF
ncbi:MAG TPA: hypothetical protein VK978_04045 [Candidatus Saccharimonadales bacterium]|nr:hypothetical protein [Candidatus Saccharimonadales bacterium]